ncbi:helix-hairpin-helix domain-containing protein [Orbaceae bacterium ESL0727]|nr:helix-hairpin-helix domain-containing protein [Orbaceae bacterium ESL0727]
MKLSTLLFILFTSATFANVSVAAPISNESTSRQSLSSSQQPSQPAKSSASTNATTTPSSSATSTNQSVAQININTASVDELAKSLKGIGLSKAQKIVEYREKFGPFASVEQLKEVSGIGQSILDKNAGKIAL